MMVNHLLSCLDIDPETASVNPPAVNPNPMSPMILPLNMWLQVQPKRDSDHFHRCLNSERTVMLSKVAIAFAIGKLLEYVRTSVSNYSQAELSKLCSVNNFSVHMLQDETADDGWQVTGVDMIFASVTVKLKSKCSLSGNRPYYEDGVPVLGRHVDAVITRQSSLCCHTKVGDEDNCRDDSLLCYLFGSLLHSLFSFSGDSLTKASTKSSSFEYEANEDYNVEPPRAKSTTSTSALVSLSRITSTSVTRLVQNLLDCGVQDANGSSRSNEAYSSLDEVIHDMHLLLLDPNRYLFEQNTTCLQKASGKLFGRVNEVSALADAFSRVASSGKSEAFIVGGYTGSGKRRLVQSIPASVVASDGLLISKKFEATSSNPLDVVLSVFNDLCILLTSRRSENERQCIYDQLVSELGGNFHLLLRAVPYVIRLTSSQFHTSSIMSEVTNESGVNFFSLCNIIQRLVRVVSSTYRPVTIVLEDIQWADAVSLGLIHTVLSDSVSSVFFIGTYRDNEVSPTHIMYGFCEWLSKFNVPLKSINIGGIELDDVNSMVSEALGMFPRLCQSLSQVVYRKTKGNPFFIETFLRSLVDKGLLVYSLRERSWLWNVQKIHAENITPNVLDLLSSNMAYLSQNVQTALKVASCFGIKIDILILQILSQASQYSSLMDDVNRAVEDGLMDLDVGKSSIRFVHDKVREAAFEMISPEHRDNFHYEIGMALLKNCENEPGAKRRCLFAILDQINHGVPSLCDETERSLIVRLNLEAGLESMLRSNYISAYNYARSAISVLPDDAWKVEYDLCLELYCLLAKAAYSYRKIDEVKDAASMVVQWANSAYDKLRGYAIESYIILNTCNPDDASMLSRNIVQLLGSLGEHISKRLSDEDIAEEVCSAMTSFKSLSDHDLLNMHEHDASKDHDAVMQAYELLAPLAFIGTPRLCPYYVAKWAKFCLHHRVASEHIPSAAYVSFAVILCQELNANTRAGHRIGQLGLKLLHQSSSITQIPTVYHLYYGYVGIWFEPVQAVIDMHRKAFGIGYQVGHLSFAALHKMFYANRHFHAGTNLVQLKEELEHDFKSEEYHRSFPILLWQLNLFHKAVLRLIGSDVITNLPPDSKTEVFDSEHSFIATEMAYLTYRGHFERVQYMGKRLCEIEGKKGKQRISFRSVCVHFYWALSSLVVAQKKKIVTERKKKPNRPETDRLISIVKIAAEFSSWNFGNKYALLMAEKHSLYEDDSRAEAAYSTAIKASQKSKFVHEEGLAWELSGMHHERLGNVEQALTSFQQACGCYGRWGSRMKVQAMQEKIKCMALSGY